MNHHQLVGWASRLPKPWYLADGGLSRTLAGAQPAVRQK